MTMIPTGRWELTLAAHRSKGEDRSDAPTPVRWDHRGYFRGVLLCPKGEGHKWAGLVSVIGTRKAPRLTSLLAPPPAGLSLSIWEIAIHVDPLYVSWGSGPGRRGVEWRHGEINTNPRRTGVSEQCCRRCSDELRRFFSMSGVPARSWLRSGQT